MKNWKNVFTLTNSIEALIEKTLQCNSKKMFSGKYPTPLIFFCSGAPSSTWIVSAGKGKLPTEEKNKKRQLQEIVL